MLLVETYISESKINGMGLFASKQIHKGTMTWMLRIDFDRIFNEIISMPPIARKFLKKYCYCDIYTFRHILCVDNARFINHSDSPNIDPIPLGDHKYGADIANRDILIGEEILIDYKKIDAGDCGDLRAEIELRAEFEMWAAESHKALIEFEKLESVGGL